MPLQLNAVAEHAWSIYHAIVLSNSHSHLPKCKIWALLFQVKDQNNLTRDLCSSCKGWREELWFANTHWSWHKKQKGDGFVEAPKGNGLFKGKILTVCKSFKEFLTKLQPVWMLVNISSLNITLQILWITLPDTLQACLIILRGQQPDMQCFVTRISSSKEEMLRFIWQVLSQEWRITLDQNQWQGQGCRRC